MKYFVSNYFDIFIINRKLKILLQKIYKEKDHIRKGEQPPRRQQVKE